jgi:hypothetical protein
MAKIEKIDKAVAAEGKTPHLTSPTRGEEPPHEIPFVAMVCAFTAISKMHDERKGFVADKAGERSVVLSIPEPDGGHKKYVLTFPELVAVSLEAV